ncbi:MAG: malto-oligosyltrehalose synthase [Vicinamibacterales bacterium]
MQPSTSDASARIPLATYRLQFNIAFTFTSARDIVLYLHELGISDVYASSYLCAVPGSMHGYDVADPTRLNPEVGSEEDYERWIAALHSHDMGHVLDIVPNHMGIARAANPWWMDVLENGQSSRYAAFFDITWHPLKHELRDKVLIPTLGDQYGAVLERQELTLRYRDGSFVVEYFEEWFPVAPDSYGRILTPALESWTADGDVDPIDADELRSIITSAELLPPRNGADAEGVVVRAREKEVVKRRLAALVERCDGLREHIDAVLTSFNGVSGDAHSFDPLDSLLGDQSYRLAHWRTASEEINYRRFFDVNQLAALRMEDPAVFDEVHRLVFELVGRGAATGLRVDHVDGLFSPGDYLDRLQTRAAEVLGLEKSAGRPLYLVVEKILGQDEHVPEKWPVYGTTGYEFAAVTNGLFVDARHARAFDRLYQRFAGERLRHTSFDELAYQCRKRVMHETMSGDINSLGHLLNRFSERNRHFRDFTLYSLIDAIREVIACFPVYRTYLTDPGPPREEDRRHLTRAIRDAKERSDEPAPLVFDFVERMLLQEAAAGSDADRDERKRFAGKFQQTTSPVAAKGIEDTALYVYNRLLSLNEVGGEPTRFGVAPSEVHAWLATRQARWPSALSATATHDTKRGEDVRARLNVLSELPAEWKGAVRRWRALNRRHKRQSDGRAAPDANEEYFIYQTLIGAWPFDAADEPAFAVRMSEYMLKALREAKVNTSWLRPDEDYERAVLQFVERVLDPRRPFLEAFRPFQQRIAALGIWNSLAQLLIKCTAPGVPDFYQGTELWDLSLVDPDNRRPIDYERRRTALAELRSADPTGAWLDTLLASRHDGRIKLFVLQRALAARRRLLDVFRSGSYVPLETTGDAASSLFAFARVRGSDLSITCVPRLVAALPTSADGVPRGRATWGNTALVLPDGVEVEGRTLTNALTGETLAAASPRGRRLDAADVFERLPVALLTCST